MVTEISDAMKIPKSFLSKIIQKLSNAGIVKSFRGARGGFILGRSPEKISLLEVIETIDGSITANRCVIEPRSCELSRLCPVHPVWVEIKGDIEKRLKRWTFAKLAKVKRTGVRNKEDIL